MTANPSRLAGFIDAAIEFPIVSSYTTMGPAIRRRLDDWTPIESYDATGRVIVLTGATSGLGLAAAHQFAALGATLVVVGRNETKTIGVRDEIEKATGNPNVSIALADMGDLVAVRSLAETLAARCPRIDVLIHNAGALSDVRATTADGTEATVASQVVGPFLLTTLLLDQLDHADRPGRVLTMSSGGMYSQKLSVTNLEMSESDYKGSAQYARAKRAQVTLNEMWAEHVGSRGIVFQAMHPGWSDTPGVQEALPTFRKVLRPFLRTPASGADTLIWLALDDEEPLQESGGFWLDRRRRSIHILPNTRSSDTPDRRARLWAWVCERAGVND